MRRVLSTVWKYFNTATIIAFLLASVSTFIPPASFSWISIFGLGFPYILAIYVCCLFISLFTEMKRAVIMLFLLPLCIFNVLNTFALRTGQTWKAEKDSTTLRVMTWNVQGFANYLRKKKSKEAFRTNKAEMMAAIHLYNPDVLCLQEYKNIENAKRRTPIRKELDSLGYIYSYTSKDRAGSYPKNPSVWLEEGVAIYSKLPILDTGKVVINQLKDKANEHVIYADVMFCNKPVRIFTAHLESFTIYADTAGKMSKGENIYEITYEKRVDAEYKIRATEIIHQQEVSIIRKTLDKSPHPAVYCGDLNITPTSYNYRLLKGDNLQDAFLARGSGIGNTFYKIGPTLRIDVCLPDKQFRVTQCKREKKKLSDHYPVIADMQWKK